jgi:uncharacterized protein
VILVDAGPLIALLDRGQGALHRQCRSVPPTLSGALITTWPCLTKALYFLGDLRGWAAQKALWRLLECKAVFLHKPSPAESQRIAALLAHYHALQMDWPQASLVSLAEVRHLTTIWTLDTAFARFKIHDRHAFDIVSC